MWNARHVWNCRGMPAMPQTQTKREHFPPSSASCPTPSDPPNARAVIARRTYRRSLNLQRSFHSCLWLLCCTVHHPISGFLWRSTCYFFDMAPNILPCTYRLIFGKINFQSVNACFFADASVRSSLQDGLVQDGGLAKASHGRAPHALRPAPP